MMVNYHQSGWLLQSCVASFLHHWEDDLDLKTYRHNHAQSTITGIGDPTTMQPGEVYKKRDTIKKKRRYQYYQSIHAAGQRLSLNHFDVRILDDI